MGLSLNCKKNNAYAVTKQSTVPECNIFVEGIKIQHVDKFNYLGSLLTSDGKCDTEIKRRIGTAKDSFKKMDNILSQHLNDNKTGSMGILNNAGTDIRLRNMDYIDCNRKWSGNSRNVVSI